MIRTSETESVVCANAGERPARVMAATKRHRRIGAARLESFIGTLGMQRRLVVLQVEYRRFDLGGLRGARLDARALQRPAEQNALCRTSRLAIPDRLGLYQQA